MKVKGNRPSLFTISRQRSNGVMLLTIGEGGVKNEGSVLGERQHPLTHAEGCGWIRGSVNDQFRVSH